MIHISSLRKESLNGWTKLIADIKYEGDNNIPEAEPSMWLAVKDEYSYMLADDVYDAFILVPLYMGMFYKHDVYIHGPVSKRLYRNINDYLQSILCDFSDDLSRINVKVDGFKDAEGEPDIIGASLSCGVDSFSVIYDRYVKETDPEYKVNGLFFFNAGWHGDYYNENTMKICLERYNTNKRAADEIGLPMYMIDSNFHAFTYRIYKYPLGRAGYFVNYSLVLGLQRAVKKFYVSGSLSYRGLVKFAESFHDQDFSNFGEPFALHLISTEKLELVIEGCQYERPQKLENLADWEITHRYLSPCHVTSYDTDYAHNCSICGKCLMTMLPLEIMGRLEDYAGVFDLKLYRKISYDYKCDTVLNRNKQYRRFENYNFAKKYGFKLPSEFEARIYLLYKNITGKIKQLTRKILGDKIYDTIKKTIKH